MRTQAHVERIVDIRPIEGADRIEVATVLGWECVVAKTDGFKVGDLVVYIEVDSIVPDRPEFAFLKDRKFRVRTIKLRKQVSQGLILPITILPAGKYAEGQGVEKVLGVKKYDPESEIEAMLVTQKQEISKNKIINFLGRFSWVRSLPGIRNLFGKRGGFPKFLTKTDETRIQNMPAILEKEKGTEFVVTEKIDGQSATYFLVKNPNRFLWFGPKYVFGVCSRNLRLGKPDSSSYWTIARKHNMEKVLRESIRPQDNFIAIQGEIAGPGIQGNKYALNQYHFFAFNMIFPWGRYGAEDMECIARAGKFATVPILAQGFTLSETVVELVEFAKGKSVLYNTLREGVVIRNRQKNISFKVINPDFLLKNE